VFLEVIQNYANDVCASREVASLNKILTAFNELIRSPVVVKNAGYTTVKPAFILNAQ
jgi:hypothetical protein